MTAAAYAGNYSTETPRVSQRQLSSTWLSLLEGGPHQKEAAARTDAFIRKEMREKSFARRILTPQVLGEDEIDRTVTSDIPVKIVEKEPDSYATSVTFRGAGPRQWIRSDRYEVRFGMVTSQRFRKNKFELMSWRSDPKKILADNAVKDCAAEEDSKFINTCTTITSANPAAQVVNVSSRLSRDGIVTGIQQLLAGKIPVGMMLCTQELWWDLARLTSDNVGDPFSDRILKEGVEEVDLFGIRTITTIKRDIVDPNDLWIFGPEQYLGNFYLLQDATLYIEQRGPEIMFYVYEAPGIGIGNTRSIIRIRFNQGI